MLIALSHFLQVAYYGLTFPAVFLAVQTHRSPAYGSLFVILAKKRVLIGRKDNVNIFDNTACLRLHVTPKMSHQIVPNTIKQPEILKLHA